MPSKDYIQQLQKLFVHFKRHGGRNTPAGVSQIELIDDDDVTHWFVQFLYKDENAIDFYVSLELVFSEEGPNEGQTDTYSPVPRAVTATAAGTSSPSVISPPTDSDVNSYGDRLSTEAQQQQQQQKPPNALSSNVEPAAITTTSKCSGTQLRSEAQVALSTQFSSSKSERTVTATSTRASAAAHRKVRMPLVFIVAPRLIASFIHHGALCSLELMSQYWEPTPENMTLLLIALHETLNPFSSDGRVSIDDAERAEGRRAAVVAAGGVVRGFNGLQNEANAGVGGIGAAGGGLPSSSAYSTEEHQLGMDYIRRAHPHLFRRHVDAVPFNPSAEVPSAAAATASATRSDVDVNEAEEDGDGVQSARHNPHNMVTGGDVGNNGSGKNSSRGGTTTPCDARQTDSTLTVSSSSAPNANPLEDAVASSLSSPTHQQQRRRSSPALLPASVSAGKKPHVLRDISHLNTAIYDALVYVYGTATPENTITDMRQHKQSGSSPQRHARMLLDTIALLADANHSNTSNDQLCDSAALRDAPSAEKETDGAEIEGDEEKEEHDELVEDQNEKGRRKTLSPSPPLSLDATPKAAATPTSTTLGTPSAICTPALNAERLLRARPPAAWHLVYAPTHTNDRCDDSDDDGPRPDREGCRQRVAELWIPRTLPQLPVHSSTATGSANDSGEAAGVASQVTRLADDGAGVSSMRCSLDVCLVGTQPNTNIDTATSVRQGVPVQASIACVLRNMRVSVGPTRALTSSRNTTTTTTTTADTPTARSISQSTAPAFRFSLQPSTAPSPSGEVHVCEIPAGLTLRCENLYLYGHLRVLGRLLLHNCILVGSITTEEMASVQVTQSQLALMPDDRLLRRAPPLHFLVSASTSSGTQGGQGNASKSSESVLAQPLRDTRNEDVDVSAEDNNVDVENSKRERKREEHMKRRPPSTPPPQPPPPPPPPALFYAGRRECILVLDSSMVEITNDSRLYRLTPEMQTAEPERHRSSRQHHNSQRRRYHRHHHHDKQLVESNGQEGKETREDVSDAELEREEVEVEEEAPPPPLAAMMTALRSLILVSNQGRLRLVRCHVQPGRNTERTVFAEQDAIVDMAYCYVGVAISSAVIVQGCRASLEYCTFEGNSTGTQMPITAAAANAESVKKGNEAHAGEGDVLHPQPQPPQRPPMRLGDATRSTGLIVELGGTLTARFCIAQHVYFAFCVIAHSVAHLYCCHANNVVNGYTVDASAATLDGCSANTNHVGVFVLRKAKCIMTDDSCGSFGRRCKLLATAYDAARRAIVEEMRAQQQRQQEGAPEADLLGTSAAAVAARTKRMAVLARQFYTDSVLHRESPSAAGDGKKRTETEEGSCFKSEIDPPQQHLGIFGGSFSLEVRDAALKVSGVTLMNARDTAVYAVDNSTLELEDCILWTTAEEEEAAAHAAMVEAVEAENAANDSSPMNPTTAAGGGGDEVSVAAPGRSDLCLPPQHRRLQSGRADNTVSTAAKTVPVMTSALKSSHGSFGGVRPTACGIKTVHAVLHARRCLITGFSFGVGTIQTSTATVTECMAAQCMNGYTIDNSSCYFKDCGADTRHVGLFALNAAAVEAESVPHVVGVSSFYRTSPRLICGGVPAAFGGDAYGVECKGSTMRCSGITVLRGRDSGFNVYSRSQFTMLKCVVDMSPTDADDYLFHRVQREKEKNTMVTTASPASPLRRRSSNLSSGSDTLASSRHRHCSQSLCNDAGTAAAAVEVVEGKDIDASSAPSPIVDNWLRKLTLEVNLDDLDSSVRSNNKLSQGQSDNSSRTALKDTVNTTEAATNSKGNKSPAVNLSAPTSTVTSPPSPTAKAPVDSIIRQPPPPVPATTLASGVKVWSGSRCYAQDCEVRCATFGFAALGPETTIEAHHCTTKHIVNGFTADGAAMQLTKCSANSNHVGIYVLSHGRCVVRRGSYTAKKYGIECRSGVLFLQGHVKLYGFSRIGLYLYAGAHCEADGDCVVDIHAQIPLQQQRQRDNITDSPAPPPPPPPSSAVFSTTPCGVEEAAKVSDLLPACIALDESTAHLPQVILGGGARCGVTCADGATGCIGQCIIHDCTLVGVNVFSGAHLTLANCALQCAQQYAVVVHVGGVCRLTRQGEEEGEEQNDFNEGSNVHEMEEQERTAPSLGGANGAGGDAEAGNDRVKKWKTTLGKGEQEETGDHEAPTGVLQRLWGALKRVALTSLMRWWRDDRPQTASNTPAHLIDGGYGGGSEHLPKKTKVLRAERKSSANVDGDATTLSLLNAAMAAFTAAASRECFAISSDAHDASPSSSSTHAGEELRERCRLPLTPAVRQHLQWMTVEHHRAALPFRLNLLDVVGVETTSANAGADESSSTATTIINENTNNIGQAAETVKPIRAASPPPPPLDAAVFPPVQPVIAGSLVIRGTCTIERMLLQPTHVLPSLLAEKKSSGNGEKDTAAAAVEGEEEKKCRTTDVPPTQREGSGAADVASLAQSLSQKPPAIHVCQHGVLKMTDCVLDASLATLLGTAPDPKRLSFTKAGGAVSAVVMCEGPYARLHCDHVHVVRTALNRRNSHDQISNNNSSSDRSPGDGDGFPVSPVASFNSCLEAGEADPSTAMHSDSSELAGQRTTTTASSSTPTAAVPLLCLSLRDGAQCTLHMMGTSFDAWPYTAYTVDTVDITDTFFFQRQSLSDWRGVLCEASSRAKNSGSDVNNSKEEAKHPSPQGADPPVDAQPQPRHKEGIMLCASKDSLAEASFSSFTEMEVDIKSMGRFVSCVVEGGGPSLLRLRNGSSATLLYCRVLSAQRAITAAADDDHDGIFVDGTSHLTFFRSAVRMAASHKGAAAITSLEHTPQP